MKSQKKVNRNEVIIMLYNQGFSSRQIGEIMGISFVASAVIVKRDNTKEKEDKYQNCLFCASKKDLLFNKKINICNKCALRFRKII